MDFAEDEDAYEDAASPLFDAARYNSIDAAFESNVVTVVRTSLAGSVGQTPESHGRFEVPRAAVEDSHLEHPLEDVKIDGQHPHHNNGCSHPVAQPPRFDDDVAGSDRPRAADQPSPGIVGFAENPARDFGVVVALHGIVSPHDNDVKCGRGKPAEDHAGNRWYLDRVKERRPAYSEAKSQLSKRLVAEEIVVLVRNRGGRFLKQDPGTTLWNDIGNAKAIAKAGQALREKPPAHGREGAVAVDRPPRQPVPVALDPVRSAGTRLRAIYRRIDDAAHIYFFALFRCRSECPVAISYAPLCTRCRKESSSPIRTISSITKEVSRTRIHQGSNTYAFRFSSPCTSIVPSPVSAGTANSHPGNVRLRDLAEPRKLTYRSLSNAEKGRLAQWILDQWRNETNPRGRVVRIVDGAWRKLAEDAAVKVVMGVLRRKPNQGLPQTPRTASAGEEVPTHVTVSPVDAGTPPRPSQSQLPPPPPSLPIVSPDSAPARPNVSVNLHPQRAPYPPMDAAPHADFCSAASAAYMSSSARSSPLQRSLSRQPIPIAPPVVDDDDDDAVPRSGARSLGTAHVRSSKPAKISFRRSLASWASRGSTWLKRLVCGRRGEELD
jgi:hypothetical protein